MDRCRRDTPAGRVWILIMVLIVAVPRLATAQDRNEEVRVKKLTPVLYVEAIEPVVSFWEDRFGFERTAEVPEGDALGFVIFERGGVQVMYQTRASVENDLPELADTPMGGTLLFIEVEDIDAVEAALEGVERVHPRRTTFYGATEIVVREPGGNVVTFAEFGDGPEG